MLSIAPHLTIRRPSPTTVEYTVSSHPPPSITAQLLFRVWGFLRIVLAAGLLLVSYLHFYNLPDFILLSNALNATTVTNTTSDAPYPVFPQDTLTALLTALAARAVQLPTPGLLATTAIACYLASRPGRTDETLLVLRGLGVQVRSPAPPPSAREPGSSLGVGGLPSWLAWLAPSAVGAPTRFIPTDRIRDVLINEAFRGFEVRYYLVLVVEGEEELVVVFPRLLPGKEIVTTVWRGVRDCLWEKDEARKVVHIKAESAARRPRDS